MRAYSSSEIVGIIGMHPNTVMQCEKWGCIAFVERKWLQGLYRSTYGADKIGRNVIKKLIN